MSIKNNLYDWQKDIVKALLDKKAFGIWLDMGLGKTPLSLALVEEHACDRILIITINAKAEEEKDVAGSWFNWSTKIGPMKLLTKKSNLTEFETSDPLVLMVNYESLFNRSSSTGISLKPVIEEFIKSSARHRVALIIDESHKMKDTQSQQTKAIMLIQKKLKSTASDLYTYLLTGTPFTTGFIDLYSQLKFLGCPITKQQFKDNFCVIGNIRGLLGWQQPIVGYKNLDALYKLIHQYAITIKSEDVVKLPEKIVEQHILPGTSAFDLLTKEKLPGTVILSIDETRRKHHLPHLSDLDLMSIQNSDKMQINPWYRNIDYPSLDYMCDTPGALWLRARQLSIGFQGNAEKDTWYDRSRLNAVERFLSQNPDNYVLFYNYTPELIQLYEVCEKLGYNIDAYSGELKSLFYYDAFAKQTDAEKLVNRKNIILANFASGSTGMNWQLYNQCIIFSLPLYKDWEQGLKRIHRIGQKDAVSYHIFRSNTWLDNEMQKALDTGVQYSVEMFNKDLNFRT